MQRHRRVQIRIVAIAGGGVGVGWCGGVTRLAASADVKERDARYSLLQGEGSNVLHLCKRVGDLTALEGERVVVSRAIHQRV